MCTLGDAADVNQVPATRVATRVAVLGALSGSKGPGA